MEMRYGVVLLAAGASRRMGRPKMLLAWNGTTVIGHLLRQWRALAATQIAVVGAVSDRALADELEKHQVPAADRILNPHPEEGMFSSIQCAARWDGWEPGLTRWIIALGDQPQIERTTLATVLRFADAHPEAICQPAYLGQRRHPVILPAAAWAALQTTPARTLRDFLPTWPGEVQLCACADAGLALDLDTPADYQAALTSPSNRRAGGSGDCHTPHSSGNGSPE